MAPKKAPDAIVGTIASPQNGQVAAWQLLDAELTRDQIRRRVGRGSLYPVFAGVYSVGRPAIAPIERATAAVLACGPGAALSHRSALTLWGLEGRWQEPFHVSAPTQRHRPGIVAHRTAKLSRRDVRWQLGIRTTSAARALLDCAPELSDERILRVLADGRRSGLIHLTELSELIARSPRAPGRARLLALINDDGAPTRSTFEYVFVSVCREHGLPSPSVNVRVAGIEVDALFAAQRLVVELDSWEFHQDRVNFESDRERDARLLAAGYRVLRITWRRLLAQPEYELRRLRAILEQTDRGGA